ncbi:MAG: phosphate acyltransferase PlsX [Lentisphaerae bacterium]|nr:phosphate acyltransferase PlsX [Lentisphaerota bacterium]
MRVAVDAMGGDYAPREIVRGAVHAARELPGVSRVILVGEREAVERELDACGGSGEKLEVFAASQVVGMDESPALAVRRKRDASVARAVDLVRDGEADIMLSAGNTGAVVVAATLKLRLLEGVLRPAIAAVMPTRDRPFVLIDAGANIDSDEQLLCQFAVMGSAYARVVLGRRNPLVGLLSIGGEEIKGSETTKAAYRLLARSDLNFKGNVEGHDLFAGHIDVAVCDGFLGNVVLKTSESAARAIGHWMRREFMRTPWRMLGAGMLRGALKAMEHKMDPETHGGAPLLGVNGICAITHGASSERAIFHAIRTACESVDQHLNDTLAQEIEKLNTIL